MSADGEIAQAINIFFCYAREDEPLRNELEKHLRILKRQGLIMNAGEACVLPIIMRPVHWEDAPFSKLQVLPMDGKPVTRWIDRDEAFLDIAREIRKTVKTQLELIATRTVKETKEQILANRMQSDPVTLGSLVHLSTSQGHEYRYTIVGVFDADPRFGRISNESPVGRALLGHKEGDEIIVSSPGGVEAYTILRIE
jgi:transcription elongation GreA/GreB family factor